MGTGRVETCRFLPPAQATRCAAVQRVCPSGEDRCYGGTAMVRKGSPVRVRQRASQTALRRGSLVLGVDQVTTSLMDRGSPVQASVATSSGERGFAARAAVVLDAIIRHGGPAGYSVGTVRSGGLPASRAALVRDALAPRRNCRRLHSRLGMRSPGRCWSNCAARTERRPRTGRGPIASSRPLSADEQLGRSSGR